MSPALRARVENLMRSGGVRWTLRGDIIDVDLPQLGRHQEVRIVEDRDTCLFSSLVLPADVVTASDTRWRDLAYRTWQRNAQKELVTFAFDADDRLMGTIEVPTSTLDDDELRLYVETLAKECDRFEYALTGEDLG